MNVIAYDSPTPTRSAEGPYHLSNLEIKILRFHKVGTCTLAKPRLYYNLRKTFKRDPNVAIRC